MIYAFRCQRCQAEAELTLSVHELDSTKVECKVCADQMVRKYEPIATWTKKGADVPYFHHGLGCVVRSDSHAKRIAKERKLIEVGNEDVNKHTSKPKRVDYECADYFL